LAYRELDDALGLSTMAGEVLADDRTGKNGRREQFEELYATLKKEFRR
jgi:hypothetical protein